MYFAAGNVQRRVMPADRIFVWCLQEAVDPAVGVVIQLNLPYAELIANAVPRSLGYLLNGLRWKLQVAVVIHEPGHFHPLLIGLTWQLCSWREPLVHSVAGDYLRFGRDTLQQGLD
jgi:hypothetical protein